MAKGPLGCVFLEPCGPWADFSDFDPTLKACTFYSSTAQ